MSIIENETIIRTINRLVTFRLFDAIRIIAAGMV